MRIAHISDTHNLEPELPDADILVHSGDLTIHGYRVQVYKQLCWLEEQRHRYEHIILTPGNHDFHFERREEDARIACIEAGVIPLINEGIEIDGVKFWASPTTPNYHGWAYMMEQGDRHDLWEKILDDTNVLITHGPPAGILDQSYRGPIGCKELHNRVMQIRPKAHLFGHAHEGNGKCIINGIQFVNSATKAHVIEVR